MAAPSAGNQQPWQFVVHPRPRRAGRDPRGAPLRDAWLAKAPLAILVCGDRRLERWPQYWEQDCAAATENLLIAAAALGLGAVWLGVHPLEERVDGLRALLGIPEAVVPFALVPVGWPAEHKGPSDRYDDGRVHLERWWRTPPRPSGPASRATVCLVACHG